MQQFSCFRYFKVISLSEVRMFKIQAKFVSSNKFEVQVQVQPNPYLQSRLSARERSQHRRSVSPGSPGCARSRKPCSYRRGTTEEANEWRNEITSKLWEARSRLYRRRRLQVNTKYSLESFWRDLQDLHAFAPLRHQYFRIFSSICFRIFGKNLQNFVIFEFFSLIFA